MSRFSPFGLAAFAGLWMLSCAAPRGGWDVAALTETVPALERYAGHRLGDLVPFPRLEGNRVQLVACRFAPGITVGVRAMPEAVFGERARQLIGIATEAFSARVRGLELHWIGGAADGSMKEENLQEDASVDAPSIWVGDEAFGARDGGALGHTQSRCDVAADDGVVRGTLLFAGIRMRSQAADNMGRPREATEAEWLGAIMHEFGHAVGFIGHVVSGTSLMVREESELRRWGRRGLDARKPGSFAEPQAEPTLSALYALSPGYVLGQRGVAEGVVAELRRLRALQQVHAANGVRLEQVVSMTGDRDARIEWRYSDGTQFGVWFRGWAAGLRAGGLLEAELDLRTRRALSAAGL